jgi:ABC-type dipeptide/oligopeptide/nickel transport system permease subunit
MIGVPLGLMSVLAHQIFDVLTRYLVMLLVSLPIFWLALVLILNLGINRDWLPLGNRCPITVAECTFADRIDHMVMPVATLVIFWGGAVAFMTRNFIMDSAQDESRSRVNNAVLSAVLSMIVAFPVIVAGTLSSLVLVETIFSWPGFGNLLFNAILQRDFPVMSAVIVMAGLAVAVTYFLSTLIYAVVCVVFGVRLDGYAVSGQFPLQAIAEQQRTQPSPAADRVIPPVLGVIFAGIALFIFLGIVGVVSTSDADPNETSLQDRLLPRGSEGYPLGTDDLGRDVQARLLAGGRTSLSIAFTAAGISVAIGVLLGLLGGAVDGIPGSIINVPLNWIMLPFNIMPMLMIILLVMVVAEPSNNAIIWAMALLGWTNIPPLVRARVRDIRRRELYKDISFDTAKTQPIEESQNARPFTATPIWNVVFSPVLMIVYFFMVNAAFFLLTEAAISFLGMGVQPPQPSWGSMLANSQQFLHVNADLMYVPGVAIALTVICLLVIAENIRRTFDFTG